MEIIFIAWIIAYHYDKVVEFLRPIDGYQIKTPDIIIDGLFY